MSTIINPTSISDATSRQGRAPRLLLVAYHFPPVGGAGVQRPVKWVKNLRRLGWDVTVVTTENPSVPVRDESLLADLPEDVLVIRARTWEPDYQTKQGLVDRSKSLTTNPIQRVISAANGAIKQAAKLTLQPDPQVLWVPNAIRAGRRILQELSHDAILVTAPPYSSFFVGTSLKRRFGLPLVMDFRDEWDMSGRYLENAQRDRFSQFVQDRMQKHLLRQADAVVATTMASTANLAEKLARLNKASTRTATIYNGFDAEDFEKVSSADSTSRVSESPNRFRLVYTGTLWNLTTIEPLVAAVLKLHQSRPELAAKLELICVGRKTADQSAILERLKATGCHLELINYCEHAQALNWLRSADAVCLLLSEVPGAERVVPAKLFEYLAIRKEMLAILPRGETADIVRRFYPHSHLEPNNVDGIADWLSHRLARDQNTAQPLSEPADIGEYSRATQTQRLVELLNEMVQRHQSAGGASQ